MKIEIYEKMFHIETFSIGGESRNRNFMDYFELLWINYDSHFQ